MFNTDLKMILAVRSHSNQWHTQSAMTYKEVVKGRKSYDYNDVALSFDCREISIFRTNETSLL